jgi:hypothetical protein
MESTDRVYGPEIFFNFIEIDADKMTESGDLIKKLRTNEIQGFIIRNLFSKEEVADIIKAVTKPIEDHAMNTPSGKMFPAPFAIVTDSDERLNAYFDQMKTVYDLMQNEPSLKNVADKIDRFFKAVGPGYKVSVPINKVKKAPVSPGSFRVFYPDRGGLFVHCGNLFQAQSEFYYSLLANDIDMSDQLSFFWTLQNSDEGGELTIYDMLWKDVKRKRAPDENDSVIDDKDRTLMLKDVPSFAVKPQPGDILVFSGGPIWHRVENIKGKNTRITYGGFVNFSNDDKEIFYWS